MNSAFYITTRLFLKRAWLNSVLAVATLVLGPLFYQFVFQQQRIHSGSADLFGLYMTYLVLSWILFLTVCLHAVQGTQKFCMGLPVRSRSIATWMMLATVGLVVLLQIVTNGAYRLLFFDQHWRSEYWPVLGPLLFLVTVVLVGHYIYWGLYAPGFLRVLCWTGLTAGLFWWFISRYYPGGFRGPAVVWKHVSLGEFSMLLVVSAGAWFLGTREFAKVRAGVAVPSRQWQWLSNWWDTLLTGDVSERNKVFVTVRTSLARLHWRDSCQRSVLVCGLLFGMAVLVINLATKNSFGNSLSQFTDGFLIIFMCFTMIAAVITAVMLGESISVRGRTEMKRSLAAAPLSDRDFSRVLFRNMLKAMLSVFLLIEAGLLLTYVGLLFVEGPGILNAELAEVAGDILKYTWYYFLSFWIIAANLISVLWAGRTWFNYLVIGGGLTLLGLIAFAAYLVSGAQPYSDQFFYFLFQRLAMLFNIVCAFVIGLATVGGILFAYLTACRGRLIRMRTTLIALVVWAILFRSMINLMLSVPTNAALAVNFNLEVIFLCTLFMGLAPFATIPLALRWNRHR